MRTTEKVLLATGGVALAAGGLYLLLKRREEKVQLTIQVSGNGTTDPAPGTYEYDKDTTITVTAIPDPDNHLDHWECDSELLIGNPLTIIMSASCTVTAIFATGPEIIMTIEEIDAWLRETHPDIRRLSDEEAIILELDAAWVYLIFETSGNRYKITSFVTTFDEGILSNVSFVSDYTNDPYSVLNRIVMELVGNGAPGKPIGSWILAEKQAFIHAVEILQYDATPVDGGLTLNLTLSEEVLLLHRANYYSRIWRVGEKPANLAVLYEHINYQGFALTVNEDCSDLGHAGWSAWIVMPWLLNLLFPSGDVDYGDKVSSVRVAYGYAVMLYEHINYKGARLLIESDNLDLRAVNFNDIASSIKVFRIGEVPLEVESVEVDQYWTSYDPAKPNLFGPPESLIPIAEGYRFGAILKVKHRYTGENITCHTAIHIGGGEYEIAAATVSLPDSSDWMVSVVYVSSDNGTGPFRNRTGLGHCSRLDVNNTVYNTAGDVLATKNQAICYHLIDHAEVESIVVEEYFSEPTIPGFSGPPGSLLPIAEGARFGARLTLRYRYLGGRFTYHSGIDIGGGNFEIAAVSFDLPTTKDWAEYTVLALSENGTGPFRNRTGLGHCTRLDVNNVVYDAAGNVIKADGDAACYHLITEAEIDRPSFTVEKYWSEIGGQRTEGPPGSIIPIADGASFGAVIPRLRHRYLGGHFHFDANVDISGGQYEVATIAFDLPTTKDWAEYRIEARSEWGTGPFRNRTGLAHCRRLDVLNVLYHDGTGVVSDWDAECYHTIATCEISDNYVVEEYWAQHGGQRFSAGPGGLIPIAAGDSFGGRLYFEHRYLGGHFTLHLGIHTGGGHYEIAVAEFDLPIAMNWTGHRVEAVGHNFNPHGLGHCSRLDTVKNLYREGALVKQDPDADCYHVIDHAEITDFVVEEYLVLTPEGIRTGPPGSLLPIAGGWGFAASKVRFQHRYLGGTFTIHAGIYIGSGLYEIAAVTFNLPSSKDWVTYRVYADCMAGTGPFRNRTGLAVCRRLDVTKVFYDAAGKALLTDGDAECYHIVA